MNISSLVEELVTTGLNVRTDVPLGLLTTYGVGGLGACVVKLECREDAFAIANVLSRYPDVPIVVMGRGSNLLVSDTGFHGVVVQMSVTAEDNQVEVIDGLLHANGAMLMPVLARRSVNAGRGGLEWCVGIPGTVGGAVRMNAGGHGADMTSAVVDATVLSLRNGQVGSVTADQLGFYFRGSALSPHHVVLSVRLRTVAQESTVGTSEINSVVGWRREHQPGGRNAGSVFVNPGTGTESAGSLIDAAHLRGYSVGSAQVSEKHANFIQASDGALASDIVQVMAHVQDTVEKVHGVRLYSEVCLVGFPAEIMNRFSNPLHSSIEMSAAQQEIRKILGEES
jgi:UDP-N-acetylmuramate dehydrogenase